MATRKKPPAKAAARKPKATKATNAKAKPSVAKRGAAKRGATKRGAAKRGAARAKSPAAGAVTVRMFCQGLGDCFLLSVPQGRGRPYSILVDCGVAIGTPRGEQLMAEVVDQIVTLTGGSAKKRGTVDLLVVTHQHWDHVSGFLQAPEALQRLDFRHLWMAWTESDKDGLAKQLRDEFRKAKLAMDRSLAKAARLAADDPTNAARQGALEAVMSFFGPRLGAAGDAKGKGKSGGLADAMTAARQLVGNDEDATECLFPGQVTKLPGAASGLAKGIEAIVLGPPHKRDKLVRINPRESKGEAYEKHKGDAPGLAINAGWNASVMKELLGADGGDGGGSDGGNEDGAAVAAEFDRAQPFDKGRGRSWAEAQQDPYFRERYFDEAGLNEDRRIDGDWLWSGAQRLALQMDSYTNNTSLVLAFELPKSKDVLLFVGDAQIGNWLSWHDQAYTTSDGRELSAAQLLARTVLYKVGHHGSHNATLREQGFELMTHPDLMAMLPVEADGVTRLGYGQMPLKSLVERLRDRTAGRILRVDQPWTGPKPPGTWTRPGTRARLAAKKLTVGKDGQTSERPVYMELVIQDR